MFYHITTECGAIHCYIVSNDSRTGMFHRINILEIRVFRQVNVSKNQDENI